MDQEDFQKLCRTDKLSDDGIFVGRVGVRQVALVRKGQELFAFKNLCPHAGSPLSGGIVRNEIIECPRHHWEFNMRSGECLDQPLYCLRLYDVKQEDGWIWVRERDPEIW